MTTFNSSNFHLRSAVTFKPATQPEREADYISDSGSAYWYTSEGVYRASNHWGRVASCDWGFQGLAENDSPCVVFVEVICGFARWEDFTEGSNCMDVEGYYKRMNEKTMSLAVMCKPTEKNAEYLKLFAANGVITADQKRISLAFGVKGQPSVMRPMGLTIDRKGRIVPICI